MAAVALMAVTLNARKFFEFQLNSAGDDFETTSIMEYPTYTVMSRRVLLPGPLMVGVLLPKVGESMRRIPKNERI